MPARQALGQALLELDDVDGAIEQLRAGIALSPESPILHFTLARAYRKAGERPRPSASASNFSGSSAPVPAAETRRCRNNPHHLPQPKTASPKP